jgi:probable O-glycosylation ligase (exosortase A-associated)
VLPLTRGRVRTLLVFGILIPGILAAIMNRFAGLLLYLWFALFRPQEWMWFDVARWRLSLMLGILFVVPSILTGVLPNVSHPLSIGGVLFLLCALLGQVNAFNSALGWTWVDFFARLLVVSLLAVTLIETPRRYLWTLLVVSSSFGFHAAKAGLAVVLGLGSVRFGEGAAGAFADNNGYAVGMAMIAPLLLACGQNLERRFLRVGYYLAGVLCVFGVIGTYSRGGFIAIAAAALVFCMLQRRRVLAILVFAVLAVPVVYYVQISRGYTERLETIKTYEQVGDESALGRLHFWKVAVDMAMDYPTGVGLFNYQPAYDTYDDSGGQFGHARSVHSSHFQVLAEAGFPGAVVWISMFTYALWLTLRIRRAALRNTTLAKEDRRLFVSASSGLIASMIAFLIGGAFVAMALNDLTWISFALTGALDRLFRRALAAATVVDNGADARLQIGEFAEPVATRSA